MSEGGASGSDFGCCPTDAAFASEVAPYFAKSLDMVEESDEGMSGVSSITAGAIS
jgi:hypothetical protein